MIAFKTRVASVQAHAVGSTVIYDHTFTQQRDSLLANLSLGYPDGYGRALEQGQPACPQPACTGGRDTMMVDVTDIPAVEACDEVVLFGKQGGDQITQAELQQVSGIGLAEQYTAWGVLNPKVVLRR